MGEDLVPFVWEGLIKSIFYLTLNKTWTLQGCVSI